MSVNIGALKAFLDLDTAGFMQGMDAANKSMVNAGRRMQSIGKNLTMGLTVPIVGMGAASIKMAADFQKSLRKINTLVGLSADRVNKMSKGVIEFSNATGESSKSLADALFVITSAGQRGSEAMDILGMSAKSAALGLGETKDIARAVTSLMNAYGKENLSAAQATDQLLAVVREGNLEASELAPVLGRVIGIAATLGIEFSEVGASIATFTRLGVDSAEAVTALRGVMNTLIKPTQGGAEALASVGMTFASLRREVKEKGLAQALIDLMQQFDGNEEALSALIPNVRALGGVLGTAGTQAAEYARITESIANANGLVDEGFQSISQDSSFKFATAMERLKNISIELGATLLPLFNDLLDLVTGMARWFTNLSDGTKRLILIFAGLAAAVGPVVTIIGTLATIIGAVGAPIIGVVAAVAALAAGIIYLAENWQAVKERISDWSWWKNMILSMVQFIIEWNPFGMMIKGYNALIELFGGDPLPNPFEMISDALENLRTETNDYEHQFGSFTDAIGDAAGRATDALKGLFGIQGGGGGASSILSGPTQDTGGHLEGGMPPALSPTGGLADPVLPKQLAKVSTAMNTMQMSAVQLGTAMQNTLNSALTEFATTLGNVFSGDAGAGSFFDGILSIVAGFMKTFGQALISAGVAAIAFKNLLLNPFAAVAAGIALVAASTVVSNLLKKGPSGNDVQGLASGGFVTDGGVFKLHKQELVTLPGGSAVTPASMARGGMGSGGQRQLVAVVSGSDLKFILDEENRKTGNTL